MRGAKIAEELRLIILAGSISFAAPGCWGATGVTESEGYGTDTDSDTDSDSDSGSESDSDSESESESDTGADTDSDSDTDTDDEGCDWDFELTATLPVHTNPRFVVSGDFDGDSATDLAVANWGSDSVSILLNQGDEAFGPEVDYPVEDGPNTLAAGDFDGDGVLDLAATCGPASVVCILIGEGDGSFGGATCYPTDDGPFSLATTDFDGDGILDLVTANWGNGTVSILIGQGSASAGDGTFEYVGSYEAGAYSRGVTVNDFNGDGLWDLAVANFDAGSVSVLIGQETTDPGSGLFAGAVDYAVGDGPISVISRDFDGDDVIDLVVTNYYDDEVGVLVGRGETGEGDGTFDGPVYYPTGGGPHLVRAGDFNDDGIADLVTASYGSDCMSVLIGGGELGIGDGTFEYPENFAVGIEPYSETIADFDGDGREDIANVNNESATVTILSGSCL